MLFFADISIFSQPPFNTQRSHLNDIKIFLSLAVFWLLFGTLKGQNEFLSFLLPRLAQKNLKIIREIPQKYWEKPLTNCFLA